MRALLDTHAFLWWVADDDRLSDTAKATIGDGENIIVVSASVAWELVIKFGSGRLKLPGRPGLYIPDRIARNGFEVLPIQFAHTLYLETLPRHHGDPFDRILIAQSLVEGIPILTADPIFARYGVEVIW